MTPGLRREIELFLAWLIAAAILGWLIGQMQIVLLIALLLYTGWHLFNINRVANWLEKPVKNTPEALGGWDEIYDQLYHLHKRHRKSRKKLTSFLKRFQKSTQALPYATIVLNRANEIEWFNPAAGQMFNLRNGIDVGQRIDNLIRQPEFNRFISKRTFDTPLEFTHYQQEILLNVTPYGKGQYLLSARDVTLTRQLDDMRRDFISNASHELRTPLTVMSGYVETMLERSNEASKMPLQKIQQQTARMEHIIGELIELAKLETASIEEKFTAIDISALLNDVFNEAYALDKGKHPIELNVEPIRLNGNYDELRMAISNLLTNAIRYTPEGGKIAIFTEKDDSGVAIVVKDEGIGIDYAHIPRLTERFYRVDDGRSRDAGGTGLGLSIVKHVLDRHEAKLQIESTLGAGSLFRCYFPNV